LLRPTLHRSQQEIVPLLKASREMPREFLLELGTPCQHRVDNYFIFFRFCLRCVLTTSSSCSYLIVKEDKTLESYGLNAGKFYGELWRNEWWCFELRDDDLTQSLSPFHSLHSLGLRCPMVCRYQQVPVPLPRIPICS
jgi:hypothetical protein